MWERKTRLGSVSTGEGDDKAEGTVPMGAEGTVLSGEGGNRAGGSVPTGEAKGVMEQREAYPKEGEVAEQKEAYPGEEG